ncbi:phosphoribosyltransferase family protein [Trichocoleus sp. DQ-U1]|uniref:ComF family protein n=1 Tax=Trichocoleus sp. DQ-U1 TaxID=2933926 RepID=UPI003299AC05
MISFSDSKQTYYLRNYHPYKDGKNTCFDDWSGKILQLKEQKQEIVNFWCEELKEHLNFNDIFAIAVVPSHSANHRMSGIHRVAIELAKCGALDATSCLRRYRTIDKLSSGGDRSLDTHKKSIELTNYSIINQQNVILIDDISTSGNSLLACKELLLEAGASQVKCVVLGKTVTYYLEENIEAFAKSAYDEIERKVYDAHYYILSVAQHEHKEIEKSANNSYYEIYMTAEYKYEEIESYAAYAHEQVDMDADYAYCSEDDIAAFTFAHKEIERKKAEAHEHIDRMAEYEHIEVENNAIDDHYYIVRITEYEHKAIENDAAYARDQVDIGADYAHLELKF